MIIHDTEAYEAIKISSKNTAALDVRIVSTVWLTPGSEISCVEMAWKKVEGPWVPVWS